MAAPAQPTAILRGHRSQVHAAAFVRVGSGRNSETRLATGDADGFVILWDLAIVRPRGVWRAHQNSILGLAGWCSKDEGEEEACQIATHGRDHKFIVWQLSTADEERLSTALPLEDGRDGQKTQQPAPWMVHVLEVNTMNFCAFVWCGQPKVSASTSACERLVAVPNTLTLEAVDIFHLPSQQRINTVKMGTKEGMLMALALFYHQSSSTETTLVLIAAFENGVAVVATLDDGPSSPATVRYRAQAHQQPVLSLDVAPDQSYFLTSSADAVIAKHPIPVAARVVAGPEVSAEAEAEAEVPTAVPALPDSTTPEPVSLLSAALHKERMSNKPPPVSTQPLPPLELATQPLKTIDTRHAGQQGLRLRQDGRLFATAGWDGRARIYSAKTLREVAVLKWHQAGCFAVAFAPMAGSSGQDGGDHDSTALHALHGSVKERRLQRAATAHWVAVGSKDGKVSLWDVF